MKIVQVDEKRINGISVRTMNADEMNPKKARIGALWQTFDGKVSVDYKSGKRVFGVYYNYESDANGEFSVLAGSNQVDDTNNLEQVVILPGQYLVFEGKGEMPQIALETWEKVWSYFLKEDSKYQRTYTTDFEYYKNQNEIEVCIAIK